MTAKISVLISKQITMKTAAEYLDAKFGDKVKYFNDAISVKACIEALEEYGKSEAVHLAEWILNNPKFIRGNHRGKWTWFNDDVYKSITTSELYNLFKKSERF